MTILAYNVHLVPYFTKRGFSPGTPSSPSLLKLTFPESNLGCRQFLHWQDSLQASSPGARKSLLAGHFTKATLGRSSVHILQGWYWHNFLSEPNIDQISLFPRVFKSLQDEFDIGEVFIPYWIAFCALVDVPLLRHQ